MSNIYSTKFMNEASATLKDKVFQKPINETYLFSTLEALREMNETINRNTEKLYVQIAEAESKEEENKLFGEYYYQFKAVFQEFANKVQQMKSRMVISIDNKVETWEDLIKNDEYISSFDKEFSYSGWMFFHMEESDYPRLNLQKLYQKEFDYLGQLMQDNGISATPSAKLKIVATVYNNFANCSGDKNWIKELIKDMVDIDDKEITRSYSECIYNSLRDKYEITVDKGMLYTCKESLADYEDVIEAATKLCDNLLYDLDKVAENIASYLFRNQDNKLKIKTDTDGVIDRDYRLDTYSMNQLDLFMKNKINQIKKLLNVYTIAIGIKFDTVADYIDQNIAILKMAKDYDLKEVEDSPEGEEPTVDTPETPEGEEPSVDGDETTPDDTDKESIEEDPDIDLSSEEDDDSDDDDELDDEDDDLDDEDYATNYADEFEEAYLFESELFELELMQEMYSSHAYVTKALLLEEENDTDKNQDNQSSNLEKLNKTADKANIWQKIVAKLVALWKKFKDILDNRIVSRIKYLKENEKYINMSLKGVDGSLNLAYTPNVNALERLNIEDLNYAAMEEALASEDAFCDKYYGEYNKNKGEKSFSDFLKEKILGGEQKVPASEAQAKVKVAFDFCTEYIEKTNSIRRQTEIIEKAQKVAQDVSKVAESARLNGFAQYFAEMEDNTTTSAPAGDSGNEGNDKNGNDAAPKSDKAAKLAIYFKVSSQVLAAKMTLYQKIFNEYFTFCQWYIKAAGGPGYSKDKQDENKAAAPAEENK